MAEWPCCHDPLRFSPVSLRFVPPPFSSPRFRNRGSFGTARANFTKAKPLKPSKEPTIIIDARCCHSTSADANSPRRNFRGQNKISYVPWSKPTIKNQGIFKTGEAREPPVKSRHFKKQRLSARVPFANSPRLYSYAEAATKRPCLNDASLMRFGQVNVHGRENPVFSSGVSGVIPPRARAERSWRQLRAQFFLCFLGCFQLGNLKMSHI